MELPLGAVRRADGQVEIPQSTRADGSTRRAVRIRAGYVPQDEVRAYRTPAQRRREEEQRRREQGQGGGAGGDGRAAAKEASSAEADLSLASLSLRDAPSSPRQRGAPRRESQQEKKAALRVEQSRQPVRQPRGADRPASASKPTHEEEAADRSAELKKQITKINRLLKDIAALEKSEPDALSDAQRKKVERKGELQREKSAIIAELNGATVDSSAASSATGTGKTRVAISL